MLDISGQCPGVIHTPLLQSLVKHSKATPSGGNRDTAEMGNKGNVWDVGTGSIPRGKANYRLKAPCLWHAAQIK